ncbi:hypothetical protein SDC9_190643 [bioreactor metagenome]|uniref:Uncharacterized protein n=1 Tax=bioreactor metagenome TaxID=1076179 RepID=A0A645I3V1_9ZZZZ
MVLATRPAKESGPDRLNIPSRMPIAAPPEKGRMSASGRTSGGKAGPMSAAIPCAM